MNIVEQAFKRLEFDAFEYKTKIEDKLNNRMGLYSNVEEFIEDIDEMSNIIKKQELIVKLFVGDGGQDINGGGQMRADVDKNKVFKFLENM